MGLMMAVSFQRNGRLYYLDPGPYQPTVGTKVLVPTDAGPEVAECIWAPQWVDDEITGLPVCAGLAGEDHLSRDEANRRRRAEARVTARRLVREHELPMKIIGVDYLDQGNVFTIYFSAPGRVDFRALAKDQDLPVNPLRIAGACGRLMCCLKYEHPLYQEFHATAPRYGEAVETPDGPGTVVGHNVPADQVVVKLAEDGRRTTCPKASVCGSRKAYEAMHGDARESAPDR